MFAIKLGLFSLYSIIEPTTYKFGSVLITKLITYNGLIDYMCHTHLLNMFLFYLSI
jgi:hypothetical protein